MKVIDSFRGETRWLSNFEDAPVLFDGDTYLTNEHFYQAHKFRVDTSSFEYIRRASSPGQALRRAHSRLKTHSQETTPSWEEDRVRWMILGLRLKFTQHSTLMVKLINTGEAVLVEGNTHGDMFWGQVDGKGLNMLGTCLMTVRSELKGIKI